MSWVPDVRKPLRGIIFFFHTLTWWAPTIILSTYFADSCCLLTMLTTREGGAAASIPKRMEDDNGASDVGVNDLGDGGAAMHALRCSQPWEAGAGVPTGAGLVLAAGGRQD